MSFTILCAVLAAAFLHALWNALVKMGSSKAGAMIVISFAEMPIGLAVALTRPMPERHVWYWLVASGCIHFFYKLFLTLAYEKGDLSRVYPIARGAAPMMVALIGAAFLADRITKWEYAGIITIGLGIAFMAHGVFTNGEDRKLLPFALGSALTTAAYTLVDGMGVRLSGDAVAYVAWVFVVDGVIFVPGLIALRGRQVIPPMGRVWAIGTLACAASYAAYAISLWAMTRAPLAVVAALRESSILFAILIGWLCFHESMSRNKAMAAIMIVTGILLSRL